MNVLWIILGCGVLYVLAYLTYGKYLSKKVFELDDNKKTPAVEVNDGVDFVPAKKGFLLGQHFSAIAAAGPINGPILAATMFGWFPAILWCIFGSILIGGVHDMGSLVASVRYKAKSITEVIKQNVTKRAWILFMVFIWITLVYLVVAFTDITAGAFVYDFTPGQDVEKMVTGEEDNFTPEEEIEKTKVKGGGIASSSIMYLCLPIIMALVMKYFKLTEGKALMIFLPLVAVAIWAGQHIPVTININKEVVIERTVETIQNGNYNSELSTEDSSLTVIDIDTLAQTDSAVETAITVIKETVLEPDLIRQRQIWGVLILIYCMIASVLPMWLLLQPRGALGGYFLYAVLIVAAIGLIFGKYQVKFPAFISPPLGGNPMFPILFITIACGACSGFHALVSSGTTSKQLSVESHAKPIGYGGMLLEGMIACVSIACVMIVFQGSDVLSKDPNFIYASAIGSFMKLIHVPVIIGISFGLMAFTTFVYDTLDICTRLGRYIFQELTGLQSRRGSMIGTILTGGVPVFFIFQTMELGGKIVPAWRIFWGTFGASNQLLAALALIGISIWLKNTNNRPYIWLISFVPALWMFVMSIWALFIAIHGGWILGKGHPVVPWISVILVILSFMVAIETVLAMRRKPVTVAN